MNDIYISPRQKELLEYNLANTKRNLQTIKDSSAIIAEQNNINLEELKNENQD